MTGCAEDEGLRDRFRGAMLGAVLGDCLGAPFEWRKGNPMRPDEADYIFKKYFELKQDFSHLHRRRGKTNGASWLDTVQFPYTDDTAMALALAQSIVRAGEFNIHFVAQSFANEYQRQPNRGYGRSARELLSKIGKVEGSKGNGAAMRTHPLALLTLHNTVEEMEEMVKDVARLTHANQEAIHGACLQTQAVRLCLKSKPTRQSAKQIAEQLLQYCQDKPPYDQVLAAALQGQGLCNGITALEAVPTAIYFALVKNRPESETYLEDVFRDIFALEGDTDTVASMAGAIAGALTGFQRLPRPVMQSCEGVKRAYDLANEMYDRYEQSVDQQPKPGRFVKSLKDWWSSVEDFCFV